MKFAIKKEKNMKSRRVPKILSKEGHEYILVKEYPNFFLYEDMIFGFKECFKYQDLVEVQRKRRKKIAVYDLNLKLIGFFNTIIEASKILNVPKNSISVALNYGRYYDNCKYIFAYVLEGKDEQV